MKLSLALDWSPNSLHAGYFVAEAKEFYKDESLDVTFVNPEDDNYAKTPAKKLADKEVHLAIAPSESVISFNTLKESIPLTAVAAALQKDASAIVVRADSEIKRPAQLDGKIFASYNARFEDDIVRQLIKNDGGQGNIQISNPAYLEMWRTVADGSSDATWVFLPWEGPKAKVEQNLLFRAFTLKDYGIPYGYSPLLITHTDFISEEESAIRAFLRAAEKGWRYVAENPEESAELLHKEFSHTNWQDLPMLKESLQMLAPYILSDKGRWGFMDGTRWLDFVEWMIESQVLKNVNGVPMNIGQIDTSMFYTNDFFK
ncbi:MAG: ABC transporter substrate-binding protein [Tunicatimonas sp.]|uniref:ABC transporter substrate-binding protein n=1 Tax=Tunicatimonas sp. TaxID=1940096 RepID=UPI003C75FA91